MFHPDDVSQIVVFMGESDLIFAKSNDHRDKGGMSLDNANGHLESDTVPEELDRGEKNTPCALDMTVLKLKHGKYEA